MLGQMLDDLIGPQVEVEGHTSFSWHNWGSIRPMESSCFTTAVFYYLGRQRYQAASIVGAKPRKRCLVLVHQLLELCEGSYLNSLPNLTICRRHAGDIPD